MTLVLTWTPLLEAVIVFLRGSEPLSLAPSLHRVITSCHRIASSCWERCRFVVRYGPMRLLDDSMQWSNDAMRSSDGTMALMHHYNITPSQRVNVPSHHDIIAQSLCQIQHTTTTALLFRHNTTMALLHRIAPLHLRVAKYINVSTLPMALSNTFSPL